MAMTLRLDSDRDKKLDQLAEKYGVSKHEAALRAIDSTFDRESFAAQVRESTQEMMVKYRDLLDRLGS